MTTKEMIKSLGYSVAGFGRLIAANNTRYRNITAYDMAMALNAQGRKNLQPKHRWLQVEIRHTLARIDRERRANANR